MDSWRQSGNDSRTLRDYRGSDDDNSDSGFQIRGAAHNRRASGSSRPRSSSRTRRPYRDPDNPTRQRDTDYRDDYYSRSDDRYDNSYSSSNDYSYSGRGARGRGYDTRDYYGRNDRGRHYESRNYQDREYQDEFEQDPYSEPAEPPDSTGQDDVSYDKTPLQFLLIRDLKNTVTEALLSKGLEKLDLDENEPKPPAIPVMPGATPTVTPAATPGATPGSLKRVFLIRDRISDKSLSYGFAEYHTISDAKAALAKAHRLADKCTIASKPILVDFPHAGVFPPMAEPAKDPKFTFQLRDGNTHRYRDDRYYASTFDVNVSPPAIPKTQSAQSDSKPKPSKKRAISNQALDTLDSGNEKKKAKTSSNQLEIAKMWGKKQAELNGEDGVEEGEEEEEESGPKTYHPPRPVDPPMAGANHVSGTAQEERQTFIIKGKNKGQDCMSCLLCGTNFFVAPEKHVQGSEAHKKNLEDGEKVKEGYQRLKNRGINPNETFKLVEEAVATPEYRDRAKERRRAEAKMGGGKIKVSLKEAAQKGGVKDSEDKPSAPQYGKGMAMLQKAGWEEGQGLGSGGGVSAPIDQFTYAAGVGLGHESSKKGDAVEEAARATRGDGFLEKTKEVARERFNRM